MSTPVNGSAAQKAIQVSGLRKNPVMGLFMLGALGITAKLTHDTYVGNEPREEQDVSAERAKKDYALMMYDAGSTTGRGPMWDGLRHFAKWMDLYGPYGLKEDFQEWRDKVRSVWKEVIIPNLIPMGISVASIYAFFGPQAVHKPFKKVGQEVARQVRRLNYGTTFTDTMKSLGSHTLNGFGKVFAKVLEYPVVAAGLVLLSAFLYKTWYEVETGRAQDEGFRHEITVNDNKSE
jgi:hypothetical protein